MICKHCVSLDQLCSFARQLGLITILGHFNVSDRLPTDAVGFAIGFLRYGAVSHHQVVHLNRPWRFLVSLRGGCSRLGAGVLCGFGLAQPSVAAVRINRTFC
jgi:hypothetical protein